jgi:hypothetical protein
MFANWPNKTRLRSFVSLRFCKSHFLPSFQILEAAIRNAITVKVDIAAIPASDEAVICFRMKFRDYPVGRGLMLFHLTTPFADDILKLPPRCLERIADRYINVFMSSGHGGLTAHDNIRGIGNNEMNPDVKDIALVMAVLRAGNHDPGADNPAEEFLKLAGFLSNARLDNIGMVNAFESDLKWDLHRKPRCTPL